MRTSLIVCVGAVLGVHALGGTATCDDADDLERLRTETAHLVKICEAMKPGLKAFKQVFDNDVPKVDALARTVITNLFEKHRNFDAVVKASEGVMKWKEWPRNSSHSKIMSFFCQGYKEKLLMVNYRSWRGPGGEVLYVLQNSFWNRPPYWSHHRLFPSMWLVVINEGKVTTTVLPPISSWYPSNHSVLGFTNEGRSLPGILVLSGPEGQGRYSSINLYAQDAKEESWELHCVNGRDADPSLRYDEDKRELRGSMVIGPTQLHTKDRPMRVICDRTGPLIMDLRTVPGANYTVKEAPLVITVTNTSDKTIRMKVRFTDERIFRTDQFHLIMRRMDGKAVQYWPKHHGVPLPKKDEKTYQEIGPKEKFQIKVDLAKTVKDLKEGEYLLSLHWANRWDENSFGGHVRAPDIKVVIKPGK